jgi:hypothetical protein
VKVKPNNKKIEDYNKIKTKNKKNYPNSHSNPTISMKHRQSNKKNLTQTKKASSPKSSNNQNLQFNNFTAKTKNSTKPKLEDKNP